MASPAAGRLPPAAGAEIGAAMAALRQGQPSAAMVRLRALIATQGDHPHILNAIASVELAQGDPRAAACSLARAAALDPQAPVLWHALARAQLAAGDAAGERTSLDRALALDPYMLPALLQKAQALERAGEVSAAVATYQALLKTSPRTEGLPSDVAAALAHARDLIAADTKRKGQIVDRAMEHFGGVTCGDPAPLRRARAYADQVAGRRRTFVQEPTGGFFPFLPAIEFFDRAQFPWLDMLEAGTETIRREFLSLRRGDRRFDPYVQFPAGVPVNQWAKLNHSPSWGAFFLWRDGVRIAENCAMCPETAALLETLPMLDVPGRAPTAMFSLLEPQTHIPPHSGVTNTRVVIHLPLVVPQGCSFRVGGDKREVREGEAWAFDDTIEHEAWNDSDQPRAILIIDGWNPFLSEIERSAVRQITAAVAQV